MLTDSISTRYAYINGFIIETMVLVVMCTTISTRIKAKVQKKKNMKRLALLNHLEHY